MQPSLLNWVKSNKLQKMFMKNIENYYKWQIVQFSMYECVYVCMYVCTLYYKMIKLFSLLSVVLTYFVFFGVAIFFITSAMTESYTCVLLMM